MARKGQAAMEFLMTYGWAILAAVIVIGVLASFGVFSPSKYVPTQCVLSAPFGCDKNQIAGNSAGPTIQLVIRNGGGESMNVSDINITDCGAYTTDFIMTDQDTEAVTITCGAGDLIAGEKYSDDITITYRPLGGLIDMKSSGTIVVKAS